MSLFLYLSTWKIYILNIQCVIAYYFLNAKKLFKINKYIFSTIICGKVKEIY